MLDPAAPAAGTNEAVRDADVKHLRPVEGR